VVTSTQRMVRKEGGESVKKIKEMTQPRMRREKVGRSYTLEGMARRCPQAKPQPPHAGDLVA
jgi:hypothetical protein